MPSAHWLTRYGPEGASSRYRAYQVARLLEARGWSSKLEPMAPWNGPATAVGRGVLHRLCRLAGVARPLKSGVLIVQKEPLMPPSLYGPWADRTLRRAENLVWDVDDAVWMGRAGAERMAKRMCQLADLVVAGNDLIADWARSHGAHATVIPTCYEPSLSDRPGDASGSDGSEVRLVWVGSPATQSLLDPWADGLRGLLEQVPSLHMRFVGGSPPTAIASDPRVHVRSWSPEEEARSLSWADYGLALQPRSPYNDHKCGFKIVQYLSYGVIPIVSDGDVHRSIIGSVGLVVAGPSDLQHLVGSLAARPEAVMVDGARRRWSEHFSAAVCARRWLEALSSLGPGESH